MSLQLDALVQGIERHFEHVEKTRMEGVPILNPNVRVQAVGFHHSTDGYLGVLITPWFINLMLLPREGDDWSDLKVGSAQKHAFPSGNYEFIVAADEPIGRYKACSLLSPILDIADHETAVTVARESLKAVLDTECRDTESSTRSGEIERMWNGETEEESPDSVEGAAETAPPAGEPKAEVSRRDFLRGRLRNSAEAGEQP